uniref:HAUS augmin-like complex subunit 6 N-terminal domain-containing protein n=1 Tax=Trichogramma kaykai TaxID=54128 RepID=A0ABD2VXI2_9HYME
MSLHTTLRAEGSFMANKDSIIRNLYDVLEKLRYPEIAQIQYKEFENTILTGSKRLDLLHWILIESPGFNASSFNKLKEDSLADKIIKCYGQIGLCNDENVLLGKCPIEKQVQFLSLLVLLVKSVHLSNSDLSKNDHLDIEKIDRKDDESIQLDKPTVTDFSPHESPNVKEKTDITEITIDETMELANLKHLCALAKDSMKVLTESKVNEDDSMMENFSNSFQKIISLPEQLEHSNDYSKHYPDFCNDLKNIYTEFTMINKIQMNETSIKTRYIPDYDNKVPRPLAAAIKNSLVLIEQACNVFNEI